MMPNDVDPNEVDRLVELITPILAGHHPAVQSAVIADLFSIWLAGHTGDNASDVARWREQLIADHIKLALDLLPLNELMIAERRTSATTAAPSAKDKTARQRTPCPPTDAKLARRHRR